MILDTRVDQCQEHSNSHADGTADTHQRNVLKRSRDGEHKRHDGRDNLENDWWDALMSMLQSAK